jgi:hypothetical protein
MDQNQIVFTRYLYVKDEVEVALLVSLLNKNEDAIFWAFELYFSGFETELLNLFWKFYWRKYKVRTSYFSQRFYNPTIIKLLHGKEYARKAKIHH